MTGHVCSGLLSVLFSKKFTLVSSICHYRTPLSIIGAAQLTHSSTTSVFQLTAHFSPNRASFLQAQRKIKSEAYYVEKKGAKQLKDKATAEANLSAVAPVLEEYGF